jgi:hypothetical protein
MSGLAQIAALLFTISGQIDLNGAVAAEARAGEGPLVPGEAPVPGFMSILTPAVELQYLNRSLDLRAGYNLRILLRESSTYLNFAPLYLHTWTLTLDSHPTTRLQIKGAAQVLEGAADYAYLPYIFGASQATLVLVPEIFSATATASAQLRATRRVTAEVALSGLHNQPIGVGTVMAPVASAPAVPYVLPHFTSLAAMPGVLLRLSEVDELTLSSSFEYQYVSGISDITATGVGPLPTHSLTGLVAIPTIGWKTNRARHSELELKAGVAFSHLASSYPVEPNAVTPVGSVAVDQRLLSLRDAVLGIHCGGSVEYYLDPILGTAAPHAMTTAALSLTVPQNWTIALEGTFVTSLKAHPRGVGTDIYYPDEVAASAELPVRHPVSEHLTVEFGGRWSDRSPFFTAPDYGFHQRQLWLYVLLTGTTRPTKRTVAP